MSPSFSNAPDPIALHVLAKPDMDRWLQEQPEPIRSWVATNGFTGALGEALLVPASDGTTLMALAGFGTKAKRDRVRFALAAAAERLPEGDYRLAGFPEDMNLLKECLGWLMTAYRFDRYKKGGSKSARLVAPDGVDADRVVAMAAAEQLTRDLINTPASDMGPDALEEATRSLAAEFGATIETITGDTLLDHNLPMIHAVGRAADRLPRLVDLRWGQSGPTLTLVGKGVCFDTGGLDLKPANAMALMKKDMGGAANVLGLARMIMTLKLPLQLRVLIPAVENSVSGNAFRPGDILTSRKGLTVEVNNTDAEGRLVLADALSLAAEETPDLMISMATLTGAARVAVGPDLAPFFTDDEAVANALIAAAPKAADPVWRLPFHEPYEVKIEPDLADLDNAPAGGFAGAITAALFLRRFAGEGRYVHFDIYGWQPVKAPGRSKGGLGQGPRALLIALPDLLGL
ncbi:leucyl aminopeptidase family protein [Primorskyibacter sp. S87]|uniref:leucyl aminopeptidase family protein n=1 Tax=Primorskyibacter sp. S87 TaxID=3415126 RepID=UPI003C7A95DF